MMSHDHVSEAHEQRDRGTHAGHEMHDKHAGHDPEMFRRRFWVSCSSRSRSS